MNRNLLGDESLANGKLCAVLFGTGRLKITTKHHTSCCICQEKITVATCAHVPQIVHMWLRKLNFAIQWRKKILLKNLFSI